MKKYKINSFQLRVIITVLMVMIPIFVIISVLFFQTNRTLEEKTVRSLEYSAVEIQDKIDETVTNIYNISEAFANSSQLNKMIDVNYESPVEKRAAVQKINNKLFASYNILHNNEKIAAILVSHFFGDELFNFQDPNCDGVKQMEQLIGMDVQNKERLSKLYWYPIQENFLKENPYGELRKDKVILGTRRIYYALKGGYPYVHIFAVQEDSLYQKYKTTAGQVQGEVYIIDQRGNLFSSSNEEAIKAGVIDENLKKQILERESDNFTMKNQKDVFSVSISKSDINDWMTVLIAPTQVVVKDVNELYMKISWLVVIGVTICVAMLIYFYKRFMRPLSDLNQSMKQVYQGNLNAYVLVKSKDEIGKMMQYYNAMLESINHNVESQLQMEKRKKKLEMAVLMAQINPHFLYNTLETIVWKSAEANRPDIGKIAASLGRMYRLSIRSGSIVVRIPQEIEHVMAYINIQKSRYEGMFTFDLRSDHEKIKDLYMLKLLIQPVVENSFLYGMEGLERQMKIRLSIRVMEEQVKIVVADNGRGIGKERLEEVRCQVIHGKEEQEESEPSKRRRSSGIGLNSVNTRLQLYFGMEYGLKIYSKEHIGTICVITVPRLNKEQIYQQTE